MLLVCVLLAMSRSARRRPAPSASPAYAGPVPPADDVPAVQMDGPMNAGEARRAGKQLRQRCPRSSLAGPVVPARRADPVELVAAGNTGRRPDLVPLRIGRMLAGPFAFLRGSAAVMAHDLQGSPTSGIHAQICGDAHVANVGFYASPERRMVLDLNDFDETAFGPWEYDLKRLLVSVVVAGREAGVGEQKLDDACVAGARAYRRMVNRIAKLPAVEAWSLGFDDALLKQLGIADLGDVLDRVVAKAATNDSLKVATGSTRQVAEGDWDFVDDPPTLTRVTGAERDAVSGGLGPYRDTLTRDRLTLLARFRVEDVAFRVVGVGSVGTRAYIVLLHGPVEDPLILQVKQARRSVHADLLGLPADEHEGRRVVQGQRTMQTVSDPLLGWTTIDGEPFLVRTFRDRKGSVDVTDISAHQSIDYAQLCGALLARAHCRSADARVLRGYVGKGSALDDALSGYARAYADVVEADHAALASAVRAGRLPAETS